MVRVVLHLFSLALQLLCTEHPYATEEPSYETVLAGWAKWHVRLNNVTLEPETCDPGLHVFYRHYGPNKPIDMPHELITIIAKTSDQQSFFTNSICITGSAVPTESGLTFTLRVTGERCKMAYSFNIGKQYPIYPSAEILLEKAPPLTKELFVLELPFDKTCHDRHTLYISCAQDTPVTITLEENTTPVLHVELFEGIKEILNAHAPPFEQRLIVPRVTIN